MKKKLAICATIAAIFLSFFAGKYISDRENTESAERRCHTYVVFAIDKIEELKVQYDADMMETLISNIYVAYESTDDGALAASLHELWNALIFDGENIVGKEDALIEALKASDAQAIEEIAMSMRTTK